MADLPGAGDAVIEFKVTVVIPCQSGNSIAHFKTDVLQGITKLSNPPEGIFVGIAMAWIVHGHGDNFAATMNTISMLHYCCYS